MQATNIDPIGLGGYARTYTYPEWKKVQNKWNNELAKGDVNVKVTIKIGGMGRLSNMNSTGIRTKIASTFYFIKRSFLDPDIHMRLYYKLGKIIRGQFDVMRKLGSKKTESSENA